MASGLPCTVSVCLCEWLAVCDSILLRGTLVGAAVKVDEEDEVKREEGASVECSVDVAGTVANSRHLVHERKVAIS